MTPEPERPAEGSGPPSPEDRRKVARVAALRPINLLVAVIGFVFFAATLKWWLLPLTLLAYAALFALAARDPFLQRRVLGKSRDTRTSPGPENARISPERRAQLPPGDTRQRLENALDARRKLTSAMEESDETTRAALEDAISELHATADKLVDAAHRRERAAAETEILKSRRNSRTGDALPENRRELEQEVVTLDAELSGAADRLLGLRKMVVRLSMSPPDEARAVAGEVESSIREMNHRLDASSNSPTPP